MATGERIDPYRAYAFKVVIQGVTQGHFTRCAGFGIKVDALRYREAGAGEIVRRIPGQVEYGDVTLKYGLTPSTELWSWFQTSVRGVVERRNMSIVMLDPDGSTEVLRWNLVGAWISEWSGAPLDALSREIAIETMTVVYETLARD